MNVKSTQSHYYSAQELLRQGQLESASREAELAVDGFWKEGDAKIVQALPLLSILRHSNSVDGDLFESLVDLPTSFSDSLMFESMSLHEQYQNDASEKMMADVNRLMKRWVEQPKAAPAEDSIVEDSVFEEMLFGEAVAEQGFIFEEEAVEDEGAIEEAAADVEVAAPAAANDEAAEEITAEVAGIAISAPAAAQVDTSAPAAAQIATPVTGQVLAFTGPSEVWRLLMMMSAVMFALGALCLRWGRLV